MLKSIKIDSLSNDSLKAKIVPSDSSNIELIKEVEIDSDPSPPEGQ